MMENVVFTNAAGDSYDCAAQGILLKSIVDTAPKPKVFRESIDGMDGELDFTEYAGEVRFESRKLTLMFRDVTGESYRALMNFINGQRLKIVYSENPNYYYDGRCEMVNHEERRHVHDLECVFVCQPYMLAIEETVDEMTISSTGSMPLWATGMSVIPAITVTEPMTLTYDGKTINAVPPNTFHAPEIVITKERKTLYLSGSGTITVVWRNGVI